VRSFVVEGSDPAEFVRRVEAEVASRDLGRVVDVDLDSGVLVVRFRYLGTSRLHYRIVVHDGGFRANLEEQQFAGFHAPFVGRFAARFDEVLEGLGARLV
jgi:hypothetical protein